MKPDMKYVRATSNSAVRDLIGLGTLQQRIKIVYDKMYGMMNDIGVVNQDEIPEDVQLQLRQVKKMFSNFAPNQTGQSVWESNILLMTDDDAKNLAFEILDLLLVIEKHTD